MINRNSTYYTHYHFVPQNRHRNDNLEQQEQALFKSWFVDFEPFKDGEFVESELGMIPEGWRVAKASEFLAISRESINPSKNPNVEYAHYSIPAYDEIEFPELQHGNEIKSNKFIVKRGMTLFSKLNPRIKRVWYVDEVQTNGICSTEFIPYVSIKNKSYFLYCYLNSEVFYNNAMSLVNGATGSHQRFHADDTLEFIFPYNEVIVDNFDVIIGAIFKKREKLLLENRNLAALRDALLPKLMSNELKISDKNG